MDILTKMLPQYPTARHKTTADSYENAGVKYKKNTCIDITNLFVTEPVTALGILNSPASQRLLI